MLVRLSGSGPLYQQVYRSLRESILAGHLRAGDRLPVSRLLARDLAISRNVVLIAYDQLIAEGYAVGRVGSGTFVAAAVPDAMIRAVSPGGKRVFLEPVTGRLSRYGTRITSQPSIDTPIDDSQPCYRYDFAYYLASAEDFPADLWRRLLVKRLRTLRLDYSGVQGDAGLRGEIARYLHQSRGVECVPDQILLVNGSQQALDLVARVLLDEGDTVVLEDPHYQGAREAFRSVGARIQAVPVDESGLDVARLPRGKKARLAYVTPSHQFPTGAILPLDRRLALLQWAENTGAYILEDDYDGEYRYEGRPVEAVQALDRAGRVIYVGTFSRILFPSLRIGYVVMPATLKDALSKAKWLTDRHTSFLQQAALADFLREGYLDRCIRRARVRNTLRRQALLRALAKHFGESVKIRGAAAGIHIMVQFPGLCSRDTRAIIQRGMNAGVRVYPAEPYYLHPTDRCELVIGYGAMHERDIGAGMRQLASAIQPVLKQAIAAR